MTLKYYTKKYNLLTNNCLHFAFSLLGVELENNSFMDIVLKPNDIYKDFLRSLTWTWTNFNSLSGLIMNLHHYLGAYNPMIPCPSVNIVAFLLTCNDIIYRVPHVCTLVDSIFVCTWILFTQKCKGRSFPFLIYGCYVNVSLSESLQVFVFIMVCLSLLMVYDASFGLCYSLVKKLL